MIMIALFLTIYSYINIFDKNLNRNLNKKITKKKHNKKISEFIKKPKFLF